MNTIAGSLNGSPPTTQDSPSWPRPRDLPRPASTEDVQEFLKADTSSYLFSPLDADAQRRAALHAARKTPLTCGIAFTDEVMDLIEATNATCAKINTLFNDRQITEMLYFNRHLYVDRADKAQRPRPAG
jgi:hypothetical protein